MGCCEDGRASTGRQTAGGKVANKTHLQVATVGNPNCGKTSLFNALTGARQHTGNWAGVTVDRKEGHFSHNGVEISIVDLPGIYSLGTPKAASTDETIARDFILSREADLIINILDASNLERNLYLTAQLIEMRVPMIVVLNMMDVVREKGLKIDTAALAHEIGCPVVGIVARRSLGLAELKDAILATADAAQPPAAQLVYGSLVEEALAELVPLLADTAAQQGMDAHWLALRLIEEDERALALISPATRERVAEIRQRIGGRTDEEAEMLVLDARYGFAHALARKSVQHTRKASKDLTDRIDNIVLNRWLGVPIFLGVMYLMFVFAINFASAFIDFFDQLTGTLLVDGLAHGLSGLGAPDWLIAFGPKGIGAGIQTVSTFIPVIGFLFLFLTFLEDSGYMARAAFVMDRFMRLIGLPGKSFVPMILGFGCTVPAVMASRTLDRESDRILTVMMSPFMSCGARLPVYALFAAAFFPTGGQNLVFLLYLIGIGAAVLTALALRNTLLRGDSAPFIMELPQYHMPTLKAMLLHTWDRLKRFLFGAGQVIVVIVAILSVMNSLGSDGSFGNENTERSVLANISQVLTPIVKPMGISEDNWPATVGLFTGIFAKEAVVGTLNALYANMDGSAAAGGEAAFDLWGGVRGAFATIPDNLVKLAGSLGDPLGLGIGDTSNLEAAAAEQEVEAGTFRAMATHFDGRLGAFAYMLAILLYMPCVAATSAIMREVGRKWTHFAIAWTSFLAYGAAVGVYQLGTIGEHPAQSLAWAAGLLAVTLGVLAAMRHVGARHEPPLAAAE
jgi:ferrous iron transport protein B